MTDYILAAEQEAADIILSTDRLSDRRFAARMIAELIRAAIARNGGETNLAYAQRLRKACKRLGF